MQKGSSALPVSEVLLFVLVCSPAVVWEDTQPAGYCCNVAGQSVREPAVFVPSCYGKVLNKQNSVTIIITVSLAVEAPHRI